jgi:hypothetical protein
MLILAIKMDKKFFILFIEVVSDAKVKWQMNLYSFADHKTMKKEPTPPELVIENSDFEYFLKNNIESLIFIESMTASSVRLTESAVVQGTTAITSIIY